MMTPLIRGAGRAFVTGMSVLLLAAPQLKAQTWTARLAPEVSGATGSGSAIFSLSGTLLSISTNWTGLSGTTTVAHIHCCTAAPRAGTVGVAVTPTTLPGFPTGLTNGSYSVTVDLSLLGTFTSGFVSGFGGGTVPGARAALLAAFDSGNAYLNIHSSTFGGGEIRGFVTTPEPSTLALLVAGLLAMTATARRTRLR